MQHLTFTINRIIDLWQLDEPKRTMPEDLEAYVKEADERRKADQAAKDAKDREDIKRWLSGEDVRPPHTRIPYVRVRLVSEPVRYDHSEFGFVTKSEAVVETSWGITVPLDEALKLHRMAGLVRIFGKDWTPRKTHKIGGWPVERISADGTLKAGCHVIPFKVQQTAARLAGLDAYTMAEAA